jgi:hypothetical protein
MTAAPIESSITSRRPPLVRATVASGVFTREALMIRVDRKLNSTDVVDALTDLFILRGPPEFIGSDNGGEFVALKVRDRIGAAGARDRPLPFRRPVRIRVASLRAADGGHHSR